MYVKPARATAKLKVNGVSQVCQTCQADVNMQPAGQKCQLKKGRETNVVSHVYQTCQADVKTCHLSIYLSNLSNPNEGQKCTSKTWQRDLRYLSCMSNLPGRREHAACRPKMPTKKKARETNGVSHVYQTCQADVKKCHLKAKNAS